MRASASGISLTEDDASLVKGMLARGDRQHDIAAWFGVNGGRIAEISTGKRFQSVTVAPTHLLPPPGPYTTGRAVQQARNKLEEMRDSLEKMIADINEQIENLDADRQA